MSVWFEGRSEVARDIGGVEDAFANLGEGFAEVVRRMRGLTTVELVDQVADYVTIKTNEGLMERTAISKRVEAGSVEVEFDEKYQAGSTVTTTGHFFEHFTTSNGGVTHRLVISDVVAPGFLGFFYRRFGSAKTGNAFLQASKDYLEQQAGSFR